MAHRSIVSFLTHEAPPDGGASRSEEHTSELQSLRHLVCRLLLEKKNCSHCHGEHGRPGEGFNLKFMPDPKPKDLSNKDEMSTLKDEEIFATIARDMKDTTPEVGDKIGDDEFAVPTMPTFKNTLSEEELWSLVAFVRTLHGMKLEKADWASLKKERPKFAPVPKPMVTASSSEEAKLAARGKQLYYN